MINYNSNNHMNDHVDIYNDPTTQAAMLDLHNKEHLGLGLPASCFYNVSTYNLRNYLAALAKLRNGSGNVLIGKVGDSTSVGFGAATATSWTGARAKNSSARLAALLSAAGVPARNDSWFGDGNMGNTALPLYDPRIAFTAGQWFIDGGTSMLSIGHSPMKGNTNGSAFAFTPANAWNKANIFYLSFSYSGNGPATVNAGGGSTLATYNSNSAQALFNTGTVTAASTAVQACNVVPTSSSTFILGGTECYDSAIPSVLIRNYGWSSSKVSDWATANGGGYDPIPAAKSMRNHLIFLNLTINDLAAGTDVNTWSASIQSFITQLQNSGTTDVVLMMSNPTGTMTPSTPLAMLYLAEIYRLAMANGCALIDLYSRWTSYAVSNPLGLYSDATHPGGAGYSDIAQAEFRLMTWF